MADEHKGFSCPHCHKPFGVDLVAQIKKEHRISFSIEPKPGELIDTLTLGGSCTDFGKLLAAVGRSMGTKTQVLIERLETSDQGKHTIHCLITRLPRTSKKAKPAHPPHHGDE